MPVLTKVDFRPPVEFVLGLREKNWWFILVNRTTSPIFNQLTSGLLHSVIHLRTHNIKQAYGFACYIGNYLSQQNVCKINFSSGWFLLLMVRHISIFKIFISDFYIAYSTWWGFICWNNKWKIHHRSEHTNVTSWKSWKELGLHTIFQ